MNVNINDLVSYDSTDHIATITINRPERMNALNEEIIVGLQRAWQHLQQSDDRVAVLHAAGDRAFSVGADVKAPPQEMWQGVPSIGVTTNKPIIAAVHGWCIGGAYVIVQMCDMVIAADNTTFKYPEAQLGFTGGLISSAVARIPHKIAMEFMRRNGQTQLDVAGHNLVYIHVNYSTFRLAFWTLNNLLENPSGRSINR